MKRNKVFYGILAVFALGIVALDQWTKWLIEENVAIGEARASILGVFHITHTQNNGSAWGMLSGQTWLFILVMLLFIAVLVFIIWKKWLSKKFELLCLAAVLGGGLGNMIDRMFKDGLVTDMICLDFMDFPVFNVADCFISVGCIALAVYVLLFDREKKAPQGEPDQ